MVHYSERFTTLFLVIKLTVSVSSDAYEIKAARTHLEVVLYNNDDECYLNRVFWTSSFDSSFHRFAHFLSYVNTLIE